MLQETFIELIPTDKLKFVTNTELLKNNIIISKENLIDLINHKNIVFYGDYNRFLYTNIPEFDYDIYLTCVKNKVLATHIKEYNKLNIPPTEEILLHVLTYVDIYDILIMLQYMMTSKPVITDKINKLVDTFSFNKKCKIKEII